MGWAFFLILLFLVGMIALFGRNMGFETVFWVCLGFAFIITAFFVLIFLSELLYLGIIRLVRHFHSGDL